MTLTRRARQTLIAACVTLLVVLYGIAWLAPSVGLFHDDAVYLVTAKSIASGHGYSLQNLPTPIPQTKYPPLFPLILAAFALVSPQAPWLKLLPLLCTFGWLALTAVLLRRMGASPYGALLLVVMTALAPTTVFHATTLLSEPLFALLLTAALLALLDERAVFAGVLAGLATLTRSAGVALIAACLLTLLIRGRLRKAVLFTAAAMLLVAPWFGWSLAHASRDAYYGAENYASLNILTSFHANEKVVVLAANLLFLLASPFVLLTGINSMYAILTTLAIVVWALIRRRQLVPDLFLGTYCAMLLCWAGPPQRFVAPVLPLVLWLLWRAFHHLRREALTACVIILVALALWADFDRIPATLRLGQFASTSAKPNDWREMQRMFAWIRQNTAPDAIIMANLDPVFYLYTGRKAIRGFVPDNYKVFYGPPQPVVTPDQLGKTLLRGATYVALTPDRDFGESPAYHHAVEALEHGGILVPVIVPGLGRDYRILRLAAFSL